MPSIRLIAALVAALALPGTLAAQQPVSPAPRLLVITLDTFRADRIGAYGYRRPTTPALDRLAGQATLFADVTCSMATTLPSHFTIFTGLTPAQHGVSANGVEIRHDVTSIFELLAPPSPSSGQTHTAGGVPSAAVVAAAVLAPRYVEKLGLGAVHWGDDDGTLELPAARITERALRWLDQHGLDARLEPGRREPFALWLHYFDTHEPYKPPADLVAAWISDEAGASSFGPSASIDQLLALNTPEGFARLKPADPRRISDLYDAEIAGLDRSLAALFAGLEARGLWDDTLIVVVGDHGQALGEQNFWGHGEHLLEPIVKVPLLIKLPGQRVGRRVDVAVETLDLLPTLAELFGLPRPEGLLGRSLAPALRGETFADAPFRLVERRTYQDPTRRGVTLFAADWKLTVFRDSGADTFHLGRRGGLGGVDGQNFYTGEGPEGRVLRQVLAERRLVEPANAKIADEAQAMLRSLGYRP